MKLLKSLQDESVAEHTCFVSLFCLKIMAELNLTHEQERQVLIAAALHDTCESRTSDIPHDVKANYPEMQKILEKIDSSKETIEKFEKEIVENISEDLNVETEDVEKAMEVLGLSIFDLLNPQNLADVTVEIKGLTDSSTLILDGDFQQLLGDISLVGKNLMQELNVTQDELADIVSMMDTAADMEFNTELNQEGMNIDSNIDSNIASDIDGTDNADS